MGGRLLRIKTDKSEDGFCHPLFFMKPKAKGGLSEEIIEKIESANIANILKKVSKGGVMTAAERSLLNEHAQKKEQPVKETYAATISDLAKHLPNDRTDDEGISERHAATWIKRQGFPKRTKHGWNIIQCKEYVRDWLKERENKSSDELLSEKRKREIEKLDIQIAEMRGNVVPLEEHLADCQEHRRIVESCFEQFLAWVSAEIRDGAILQKAKEICNRTKNSLNEKLEHAG